EPGENCDFIVERPLSEQGTHMYCYNFTFLINIFRLICSVNYSIEEENKLESRSFRKIFKFPVNNPLSMKGVKMYTFQERVFVHLELQNLMDGPLYVESVKLDPSVAYKLVDHSTHNTGPSYHHPMLKGESRRFLYELEPKNHRQSIKGVTALGKIALSWKGIMGESGTLVTNTIQHKGIVKQEIEAIVSGIQEEI